MTALQFIENVPDAVLQLSGLLSFRMGQELKPVQQAQNLWSIVGEWSNGGDQIRLVIVIQQNKAVSPDHWRYWSAMSAGNTSPILGDGILGYLIRELSNASKR